MFLFLLELFLTAVAIPLAFLAPRLGDRWFSSIERRVRDFAANRKRAVLAVLLLALTARVAVLPVHPIPHPGIHDEFSHWLVADTLLQGRLANPVPRMWIHFETFHENFTPAYASMYYPGQGMILALGKLLLGHPFWGVWLSTGLMCAAICWALQAWMPTEWAFLGAVLAIIRLGTFSYWGNSYWGGSFAALGGALALGALPRLKNRAAIRDSLLMGCGMSILAVTRPYESLFLCVPVVTLLVIFLCRNSPVRSAVLSRTCLPIAAILFLTMCFLAAYFCKTAGSPFRLPYQVNMRTYGYVYFPWQKFDSSVKFNHDVMRRFYVDLLEKQQVFDSINPAAAAANKAIFMWFFFLGPTLSVPALFALPATPANLKFSDLSWEVRALLIFSAVSLIGLFLPAYFTAHYAAPMVCLFYALLLHTMRLVHNWSPWNRQAGKQLVRFVPVLCAVLAFAEIATPQFRSQSRLATWYSHWDLIDRAPIEAHLLESQETNARFIVIVRYSPVHDSLKEWVYNRADIDSSRIIWARDMGREKNQELISYYHERKVWLLEPDFSPPLLRPYPVD